MDITIKERDSKGFAMAHIDDTKAGIMTYSIAGKELIIIDHTEVEPAYEGKSVGKNMLLKIVDLARDKNIKIMPLCPFAAAMFKKMPEIGDVVKI